MLALALPMVLSAQSIEVVSRSSNGDTSRTDLAVRVSVPLATVEAGYLNHPDGEDVYVASSLNVAISRVTLGLESQLTPSAEYLSRSSLGGSVAVKTTKNLSVNVRGIQYRNVDKSVQTFLSLGADYAAGPFTLSGNVGHMEDVGKATGLVKINHMTKVTNTTVYASNNYEVPDSPWSTWIQKEIGVTERISFSKHFTLLLGTSTGQVADRKFRSFTLGSRYNF
jgi:hypothetical protein